MEKKELKRWSTGRWEGFDLLCAQPGVFLRSSPYGKKKKMIKSCN